MADLPGHQVDITSTCMMKLERFDEIGTRGKHSFENKIFLEMVLQFLEEIIIYERNQCRTFRETLVYIIMCERQCNTASTLAFQVCQEIKRHTFVSSAFNANRTYKTYPVEVKHAKINISRFCLLLNCITVLKNLLPININFL